MLGDAVRAAVRIGGDRGGAAHVQHHSAAAFDHRGRTRRVSRYARTGGLQHVERGIIVLARDLPRPVGTTHWDQQGRCRMPCCTFAGEASTAPPSRMSDAMQSTSGNSASVRPGRRAARAGDDRATFAQEARHDRRPIPRDAPGKPAPRSCEGARVDDHAHRLAACTAPGFDSFRRTPAAQNLQPPVRRNARQCLHQIEAGARREIGQAPMIAS